MSALKELGEADASGKARPIRIKDSEFIIPTETVIFAIGTKPNPIIFNSTKDLEINKWGIIMADEQTQATSIPGVYCCGDASTGATIVMKTINAGKYMAEYMLKETK